MSGQHYSSFGEAAGAAMEHNARMAARHAAAFAAERMTRPYTEAGAAARATTEAVLSPTLRRLRDALAETAMTPAEALLDAQELLADHARELAEQVDGIAAPDCSDMDSLDDAWECGNADTATALRRYADNLDQAAGGES